MYHPQYFQPSDLPPVIRNPKVGPSDFPSTVGDAAEHLTGRRRTDGNPSISTFFDEGRRIERWSRLREERLGPDLTVRVAGAAPWLLPQPV